MKYLILALGVLFLMVVSATSLAVIADGGSDPDPDRADIFETTGYHVRPPATNPLMHWNVQFGTYFMYEPLFDYNYMLPEGERIIDLLGTDIEWADDGETINIKLRENVKWSDGEDFDAEDVIYTFENYCTWIGSWPTKVESIEEGDTALDVVVTMNASWAYSREIFDLLTRRHAILPEHAFSQAIAAWEETAGNGWYNFPNDWLSDDYEDDWKAATGPYLPEYYSDTFDREVFKVNEDWWGFDDDAATGEERTLFGTLETSPTYIAHNHYPNNAAGNLALEDGNIDLSAKYVPRIWSVMQRNPNINTWTNGAEPYYLSQSSLVELVFNFQRYPFGEHWVREMIGYAIDYDDVNQVASSGYLTRAKVGRVDNNSENHQSVYDEQVEEDYGLSYDINESKDILEANTVEVGGVLYTKDVSADLKDLPVSLGGPGPDQNTTMSGHNVRLVPEGGWTIIVPQGWSDSVLTTTAVALSLAEGMGLATSPAVKEQNAWVADVDNRDFDMAYQCCGPKLQEPVWRQFQYMLGQPNLWAGNNAGWKYGDDNETRNPNYDSTFYDTFQEYDIAEPGSAEEKDLASEMQVMIAEELPTVPLFGNGYWYTFSTDNWGNFPTAARPWLHPTTVWSNTNPGAMIYLVMGLTKGGDAASPLPIVPIFLSLATVATAVALLRRRRQ